MIERIALMSLNIPYLWGGKNPLTGFDCSGFSEWILQSFGMDPPGFNRAQALYDWLLLKGIGSGPQAGAFTFYGKSVDDITHIALMLSEHLIIEAGGGDSTTTTLEVAKRQGACVRIRPFGHRKDLVAVVMPSYPNWVKL